MRTHKFGTGNSTTEDVSQMQKKPSTNTIDTSIDTSIVKATSNKLRKMQTVQSPYVVHNVPNFEGAFFNDRDWANDFK